MGKSRVRSTFQNVAKDVSVPASVPARFFIAAGQHLSGATNSVNLLPSRHRHFTSTRLLPTTLPVATTQLQLIAPACSPRYTRPTANFSEDSSAPEVPVAGGRGLLGRWRRCSCHRRPPGLSSSATVEFRDSLPEICQKLRHTQPHAPTLSRPQHHGSPWGLRGDVRSRWVARTTRASMACKGSSLPPPDGVRDTALFTILRIQR
jgi:hypothetical protein